MSEHQEFEATSASPSTKPAEEELSALAEEVAPPEEQEQLSRPEFEMKKMELMTRLYTLSEGKKNERKGDVGHEYFAIPRDLREILVIGREIRSLREAHPSDLELQALEILYKDLRRDARVWNVFFGRFQLDKGYEELTDYMNEEVIPQTTSRYGELSEIPAEAPIQDTLTRLEELGIEVDYVILPEQSSPDTPTVFLFPQIHTSLGPGGMPVPGSNPEAAEAVDACQGTISNLTTLLNQNGMLSTAFIEGAPYIGRENREANDSTYEHVSTGMDPSMRDGLLRASYEQGADFNLIGLEDIPNFYLLQSRMLTPGLPQSVRNQAMIDIRANGANAFLAFNVAEYLQHNPSEYAAVSLGMSHETGEQNELAFSEALSALGVNVIVINEQIEAADEAMREKIPRFIGVLNREIEQARPYDQLSQDKSHDWLMKSLGRPTLDGKGLVEFGEDLLEEADELNSYSEISDWILQVFAYEFQVGGSKYMENSNVQTLLKKTKGDPDKTLKAALKYKDQIESDPDFKSYLREIRASEVMTAMLTKMLGGELTPELQDLLDLREELGL